jgi:hypothetical protein
MIDRIQHTSCHEMRLAHALYYFVSSVLTFNYFIFTFSNLNYVLSVQCLMCVCHDNKKRLHTYILTYLLIRPMARQLDAQEWCFPTSKTKLKNANNCTINGTISVVNNCKRECVRIGLRCGKSVHGILTCATRVPAYTLPARLPAAIM